MPVNADDAQEPNPDAVDGRSRVYGGPCRRPVARGKPGPPPPPPPFFCEGAVVKPTGRHSVDRSILGFSRQAARPSDISISFANSPQQMGILPPRSTRGKRYSQVISAEKQTADDAFWSQAAFGDHDSDDDFHGSEDLDEEDQTARHQASYTSTLLMGDEAGADEGSEDAENSGSDDDDDEQQSDASAGQTAGGADSDLDNVSSKDSYELDSDFDLFEGEAASRNDDPAAEGETAEEILLRRDERRDAAASRRRKFETVVKQSAAQNPNARRSLHRRQPSAVDGGAAEWQPQPAGAASNSFSPQTQASDRRVRSSTVARTQEVELQRKERMELRRARAEKKKRRLRELFGEDSDGEPLGIPASRMTQAERLAEALHVTAAQNEASLALMVDLEGAEAEMREARRLRRLSTHHIRKPTDPGIIYISSSKRECNEVVIFDNMDIPDFLYAGEGDLWLANRRPMASRDCLFCPSAPARYLDPTSQLSYHCCRDFEALSEAWQTSAGPLHLRRQLAFDKVTPIFNKALQPPQVDGRPAKVAHRRLKIRVKIPEAFRDEILGRPLKKARKREPLAPERRQSRADDAVPVLRRPMVEEAAPDASPRIPERASVRRRRIRKMQERADAAAMEPPMLADPPPTAADKLSDRSVCSGSSSSFSSSSGMGSIGSTPGSVLVDIPPDEGLRCTPSVPVMVRLSREVCSEPESSLDLEMLSSAEPDGSPDPEVLHVELTGVFGDSPDAAQETVDGAAVNATGVAGMNVAAASLEP